MQFALRHAVASAVRAPPASTRQPSTQPSLPHTACAETLRAWQRQSGLAATSRGLPCWQTCCTCRCAEDLATKEGAHREKGTLVFCPTSLSSCTFLGAST